MVLNLCLNLDCGSDSTQLFKTGAQMHLQWVMHVHNQKHRVAVNNSCQLGHLVLVMRSQGQSLKCLAPSISMK